MAKPSEEHSATTPEAVGAHSGAIANASLWFVALVVPAIINAGLRGLYESLVYILCFAILAAVVGCIIGEMAARREHVWSAALVGGAFSASLALALSFFFAPPGLLLFAASIGTVSGSVSWHVATHWRDQKRNAMLQISLMELVVIVTAVAVHLAAYAVYSSG